jgi:mannose-6-phosphate isomerase class I
VTRGSDGGFRSVIAAVLGRASGAKPPEAEQWLGAHPEAPSRVLEASYRAPGKGGLRQAAGPAKDP